MKFVGMHRVYARFRDAAALRPVASGQFLKVVSFAAIGVMNTAIDLLVYTVLTVALQIHPLTANVVSFSLGSVNSFWMNGLFTFRRSGSEFVRLDRFVRFAGVTALCLGLSTLALHAALFAMSSLAAKLCSVLVTFSAGFLLNKHFVFFEKARPGEGSRMHQEGKRKHALGARS
ncbi:GtrA family protein (plasmid) [Skermanella sp. TT6]|uniref:GtrA family protein n=1 Tax=Skermanella cutis TaxID=2775420 RepID=A0ABX7BIY4_9PROT|nr:GtrA family protein [Skermanella sp. TT6]QQP93046.1 GtrA family protein [Skermanella sp. TT6]